MPVFNSTYKQNGESNNKKFVYYESTQQPLKPLSSEEIRTATIDPTTGEPYSGIIIQGLFASLTNIPNNNKRIYDVPTYLELLEQLKKQITGDKGLYGELEHPEKYSINYNNVSHKILDVWFNEQTSEVMGTVLLLNTPKGKIAQEIIKSGGKLSISARAGGEEVMQSDGTALCYVYKLITYDLVYHPGFSDAVLGFDRLNESTEVVGPKDNAYAYKVYYSDLGKISNAYSQYINMNEAIDEDLSERRSMCFQQWYMKHLFESDQKQEEKIIQENKPSDEEQKQKQLEVAVNKQLNEEKRMFFEDVYIAQKQLKKQQLRKSKDRAYFDNSAGFIDADPC